MKEAQNKFFSSWHAVRAEITIIPLVVMAGSITLVNSLNYYPDDPLMGAYSLAFTTLCGVVAVSAYRNIRKAISFSVPRQSPKVKYYHTIK